MIDRELVKTFLEGPMLDQVELSNDEQILVNRLRAEAKKESDQASQSLREANICLARMSGLTEAIIEIVCRKNPAPPSPSHKESRDGE